MGRNIFAAAVAVLFIYIASPLIFPVAMGAVLATLFFPWLERLERRKLKTHWAALLLTFFIALFFMLPLGLLIFIGVKDALQQIQSFHAQQSMAQHSAASGGWANAFLNLPKVHAVLERITEWFP